MLMRKIFYATIITAIFLSACSSLNSSYQKHLKRSIDQMNDMEYNEAIDTLNNMLEKDLPGDRFEERRTYLVEDLISEAEYMQEHIDSLTSQYESAMEAYNNLDEDNLESLASAYTQLSESINAFGDMTQLDMHKELSDSLDEVEAIISDKIASYEKDFNDGLENANFTKSETALNKINEAAETLSYGFSDDLYETYEQLNEKYQEEINKYAQLPLEVAAWEKEVVKNDIGSIHMLGARATNDIYEVYIKLTDDYVKAGNNLTLSPQLITKSGDKLSAYQTKLVNYDDYAMLVYMFENYNHEQVDDIVRIEFEGEKEVTVEFDGNADDTVDIAGVKVITGTFSPDISVKSSNYTVNVKEIEVTKEEMTFTGTVEPTKDINLQEIHGVYFPVSHQKYTIGNLSYPNENEYYKGTENDFSINMDLSTPLTEINQIANVQLYGEPFAFDFAEEKQVEQEESIFLYNLPANIDGKPYYQQGLEGLVKNQAKKTVAADSILYLDRYSSTSIFELGGNYKTLKTTLHITEDGIKEEYDDLEVQFYSYTKDGESELIHTETLKEKHKAKDIEVDLKGVDRLMIKFDIPLFKSFPGIILEEPFIE